LEPITSADGTTLHCEQTGQGPSLLLVHGTSADHSRWAVITTHLERRYTVFAMDRRGRGGSGDGPVYHLAREAEDVAAVIEAIGGPVAVLAHSYGAVCALEASMLTASISRMALYEPPIPTGVPMYPPGLPDEMQALLDDGAAEAALELFFRQVVRMPEADLAELRLLPMWQRRVQLAPTIPRELTIDLTYVFDPARFAELVVPTLLLLGGDSPDVFSRAIAVLAETIPVATVTVLPGQQHVAMDTALEVFLGEVLRFLDG
jgi:pimeloyl-ACP methyl ester carboxylesterase